MQEDDPRLGGSGDLAQGTTTTSGNWWEGPPPAGYTGPWPPPLPPGASYGPNFGQIIFAGPTPQDQIPGYTPPTGTTTSPDYHPEWWGNQPATPTTPGPGPGPAPGPGGGGGGGTTGTAPNTGVLGDLMAPFTQTFSAPGQIPLPNLPMYKPPPAFNAPSYQDAESDPGYIFSRNQGLGAIQNSRAAQGLWGTGATGKALEQYASDLAATHYNDVYQRALGSYLTNYDTQFKQPYDYNYRQAYDTSQVAQRQNELNYDRSYSRFLDDYNRYRTERNDRWNILNPFIFT